MNNLIQLIIGDHSGDGHEKTETLVYEVKGGDAKAAINAYAEGCKTLGIDPLLDCEDYEDRIVKDETVRVMMVHHIIKDDDFNYRVDPDNSEDLSLSIDIELFADFYARIVRLGNPNIILTRMEVPAIDIGGYGLFS